jgi:hypothetical protein
MVGTQASNQSSDNANRFDEPLRQTADQANGSSHVCARTLFYFQETFIGTNKNISRSRKLPSTRTECDNFITLKHSSGQQLENSITQKIEYSCSWGPRPGGGKVLYYRIEISPANSKIQNFLTLTYFFRPPLAARGGTPP